MVLVLFCLAIGGVLGWGAWSQARDHWTLASRGIAVEGRILGYEEVRGRRSTTTYPVLGFRTPEGRVVRARSGVSAAPSELPPGSPVRIVYDPADPASNARTAAALAAGPGVTPWILGGLAALMAGLGVVLALPRRAVRAAATPPGGEARAPIATAPRDGTEVLVHCMESTPDPARGTLFLEVARPARFDRASGTWVTTDQWRDTVYPASWSRLPNPPR